MFNTPEDGGMTSPDTAGQDNVPLPDRGYCAHRGAYERAPENTLPGIAEAVALGAPMIEIDVRLSRDGVAVLMHDATVDRTTNGRGAVADLTLEELRRLDAGSHKGERFAETRIPTFREALGQIPAGIWINVHVKGGEAEGKAVATELACAGRLREAFLAAGVKAIRGAREAVPGVKICYMERKNSPAQYVADTIAHGAQFIQFTRKFPPSPELTERLHRSGIRSNYFYAETLEEAREARKIGVDFILVNDLVQFLG